MDYKDYKKQYECLLKAFLSRPLEQGKRCYTIADAEAERLANALVDLEEAQPHHALQYEGENI